MACMFEYSAYTGKSGTQKGSGGGTMLCMSEWGWIGLTCAMGLWGGTGCLGWEFTSTSKIRYWAGWFFVVGYRFNAETFRGGMGSVLGHLLANMDSAQYSHARGCVPASFKVISASIGVFERVYRSTRLVEWISSNSVSTATDMAAFAGKFVQTKFWWCLLWWGSCFGLWGCD